MTSFFESQMYSNKCYDNESRDNNDELKQFIEDFTDRYFREICQMMDKDEKDITKKNQRSGISIFKPQLDKRYIENYIQFEQQYKEIPCRSIILGNIPKETTNDDIKYILSEFGDYEFCNWNQLKEGKITIRFYNLLDAMMMRASTINIHSRSIIMSFGNDRPVEDKKHPPNNGTIVIFNLPVLTTDEEIRKIFIKYGDIRDIRKTPNKNTQRFVEFYDSRSAHKAKKVMKKKKLMINGIYSQINVEFSLPGNYRINHEKYYKHSIPTIQRVVRAN